MNRNSLLLGLVIAAATGVASAESYTEQNPSFVSVTSREAVQAEVQAFKKAPNVWSTSYNPLAQFRSENTREQVSAEYIADREVFRAFTGESSGSAYLAGRSAAAGATLVAARPVTIR